MLLLWLLVSGVFNRWGNWVCRFIFVESPCDVEVLALEDRSGFVRGFSGIALALSSANASQKAL